MFQKNKVLWVTNFSLMVMIFFQIPLLCAQTCYEQLSDASGLNHQGQHPKIEEKACELTSIFPNEFQNSFSVKEFGFYLHNETSKGGFPEAFTQVRSKLNTSTPSYYLLFGKQTDNSGIYTRIWVDLKLPTTGQFACMNSMQRDALAALIQDITNKAYNDIENIYYRCEEAEIIAMDALKAEITKILDCCYAKSSVCTQCLSFDESDLFFKSKGFQFEPTSVQVSSSNINIFNENIVKNYVCKNNTLIIDGAVSTVNTLISNFLNNEVNSSQTALLIITSDATFCNSNGNSCPSAIYDSLYTLFNSTIAAQKKWYHITDKENSDDDGLYILNHQESINLTLLCTRFWKPTNENDGWLRIKHDGESGSTISGQDQTIAWSKDNTGSIEQNPVGYVSGFVAKISANFKVSSEDKECPEEGEAIGASKSNFYVRGKCKTLPGVGLREQQLKVKNGIYIYPKANLEFENGEIYVFPKDQVEFYESFQIEWEFRRAKDDPWEPLETSQNRLYITHAAPIHDGDEFSAPYNYTVLHLGCTSAKGQKTPSDIVNKIYGIFIDNSIKKVENQGGLALSYWKVPETVVKLFSVNSLLDKSDGRCGIWALFMQHILLMQGISSNELEIQSIITFNIVDKNDFFTKVSNTFGSELFPYVQNEPLSTQFIDDLNLYTFVPLDLNKIYAHASIYQNEIRLKFRFLVKSWDTPDRYNFFWDDTYVGMNEALTINNITLPKGNNMGIKGQGNDDPLAHFGDHSIVRYPSNDNGHFFDPSYGSGSLSGYNNTTEWVENSLNGEFCPLLIYFADQDPMKRRFILYNEAKIKSNNIPIFLKFINK
jgi:hypothetical protein